MFLDEPTPGWTAPTPEGCGHPRRAGRRRRDGVLSIHQPRPDVFRLLTAFCDAQDGRRGVLRPGERGGHLHRSRARTTSRRNALRASSRRRERRQLRPGHGPALSDEDALDGHRDGGSETFASDRAPRRSVAARAGAPAPFLRRGKDGSLRIGQQAGVCSANSSAPVFDRRALLPFSTALGVGSSCASVRTRRAYKRLGALFFVLLYLTLMSLRLCPCGEKMCFFASATAD